MGRVTLIVVALLLSYVGGYLALLQPVDLLLLHDGGSTVYRMRFPGYRVGGPVIETAFRPLLWLDQRIRLGYWASGPLPNGSDTVAEASK
jgi:hypothetical protein